MTEKKETNDNFLKKHADTVVVLAAILSSVLWMNGKINEVETRLTKIETVLICKNIMPNQMVFNEKECK